MVACDHPPVPMKVVAPHSARPFDKLLRPYATVLAYVDEKGRVVGANVGVSSGNQTYDKAAVAAMKAWTFVPAAAGCQSLPGESEFAVGGNDTAIADPCNHEAILTRAVTPSLPGIAATSGTPMHAGVTVSIDQFGEVTKVLVTQKSGSPAVDDAALKAAMASNYFPAVKNCMPVPNTYVFTVDFGQ